MKIRINTYSFIFLGITFRYLVPTYVSQIIEQNNIFNTFIMLLSLALMGFMVVTNQKPFDIIILLFLIPYLILLFSTYIGKGNLYTALVISINALLLCMIVGIVVGSEEKMKSFIYTVRNISLMFFLINMILVIMMPNGIYKIANIPCYLYGNPNAMIRQILPGMCCSCIIDAKTRKKISISTCFFFLGSFFILFKIYFSATSFIALIFIFAWLLFKKKLSQCAKWIYIVLLLIVIYTEITIVLSLNNNFLANFVTDFFNKSSDFSGRTMLWARAYNYFIQKPILGNGYQDARTVAAIIGNQYGCHNYYLDILWQRGLIGLCANLSIVLFPVLKGKKINNISTSGYILMGFCSACILMFLTEPFYASEYLIMPIFYAFIALLCKRESIPVR